MPSLGPLLPHAARRPCRKPRALRLQRAPRSRRLSLLGSEPPLSAVTLSRPQAGVSASALARRSLGSRSDPGKCQIMPLCCSGACCGFSLYSLAPGRGGARRLRLPGLPRTSLLAAPPGAAASSLRLPLSCQPFDPLGSTFVHGVIMLAQVTQLCLLLIAGPPAPQLRVLVQSLISLSAWKTKIHVK